MQRVRPRSRCFSPPSNSSRRRTEGEGEAASLLDPLAEDHVPSCWCVEKALIDAGIDYEVVVAPRKKGDRADVERLTGQQLLPAIELADGTSYREESTAMADRIRAGGLFEGRDG